MNFIIKKIIKKVFEKYLNLQQELNIQSGLIKLPYGKINHQQINKKLEPFNIQISESIYKNLSISIPLTQIVSKPIKISIERFEVIIAKKKRNKSERAQQIQQKQNNETANTEEKTQIEEEVNKYSKTIPPGKQEVNSGYIKNMVNRLLYNMEILFEKVVIKIEKDDQKENSEGLESYLSDVQFEISQLHLRNSLVLLQANIIKKIFNLQQILIKHKFAELIIKDFNICLDYNNRKLNVIAILGSILFNIKSVPYKEIQKLVETKKKNEHETKSQRESTIQAQPKQQNHHHHNHHHHQKQKPIQLNLYLKINQADFMLQNLFSLRGQILQVKYKNYHENPSHPSRILEKHSQVQVLFKSLILVHLNQTLHQELDFVIIRYLPWCQQVKIFSEYEDNILKSSLLKFHQKEIHQRQYQRVFNFNKNENQFNSATSFDQKKEDTLTNQLIRKEIALQLYYVDLMVDYEIAKKFITKILKNQQLKSLLTIAKSKHKFNVQSKAQAIKYDFPLAYEEQKNNKEEIEVSFIVYRLMLNLRLMNNFSVKLYGSFRGGYSMHRGRVQQLSFTESSIRKYPSRPGHVTEYVHSHTGKHTHKKRNSNKEGKPIQSQIQLQKNPPKTKDQTVRISQICNHHHPSTKTNQQIRFQLIQMCIQCKGYRVIDFGTVEVKVDRNNNEGSNEIVAVGTNINTELSIKLIKDIISFVPQVQQEIKQVSGNVEAFFGKSSGIQHQRSANVSPPTVDQRKKEKSKKRQTSLFLKLNEFNIKFGSLVKTNSVKSTSRQRFVWIFLVEVSNLSLGTKLLNVLKLKLSTNIYVTSPHTLHRMSITKNPVDFKVDYKSKRQTVISICNDLQLNLDQNCIQILLKYFSQLSIQQSTNSPSKDENRSHIFDNDCYLVEFYNSTQKQIHIIQANEYEVSEDSINLSEFQQNDQNQSYNKDYKIQQKVNIVRGQETSPMFWLNEYYLAIVIDGYRSHPISLQFNSTPIPQVKSTSKYYSEQQVILKFEEENQKNENKYILQILLNYIGKIQKIILKHNVCFLSYKNSAQIYHLKSKLVAYSNLFIDNLDTKITDHQIIDIFRSKPFIPKKNIQIHHQNQINYEFLLDLNEQSKDISFSKGENGKNKNKYKVSGLILRSPNSKTGNSLYSLFGIYCQGQKQQNLRVEKPKEIVPSRLFYSYLYQIRHLETSYFVQMPYLIIQNNLSCEIQIQIFDKKTQVRKMVQLHPFEKKDLYPTSFGPSSQPNFDFYNKQFTMKLKLIGKEKGRKSQSLQTQAQILYESEQHYFNTFFMVQHEFQTLIALRSNKKYQFDKKYIFLREELMLKTKVLKLQSPCRIINKTNFNFGLKFKKSQIATLPQVKSPRRITSPQKDNEQNLQILPNFILLPEEQQNNHILIKKKSEIQIINQFRAQQTLEILFENLEQTKVDVQQEVAKQGWIQILSFNFAQKDKKVLLEKHHKYCHLLFRLRLKTIQNHQFIVIQNFITFQNLSLEKLSLNLQPEKIIQNQEEVVFPLPPTTIKKFNNRAIILSSINQIEPLYQELFSFGMDEKTKSSNSKPKKLSMSQKMMDQSPETNSENIFILINCTKQGSEYNIPLKDLLSSKNNVQQVNLGTRGTKIFSLLKDIKGGIIRLFFLQKLFNPNLTYLLLNNNTNKNLLISSDRSQYTHHFIKGPPNKEKKLEEEEKTQKIFVHKKTFSILPNKDDFELFLCDENGKHLEKSTKQNLQKEHLQMEFHSAGNFQLVDLSQMTEHKHHESKDVKNQPKLSIKTHLISININLYGKIFLNLSISNIGIRVLQKNKFDCLVQDVSLKNYLTSEHILRIPQESYVLFQGKKVGNENSSKFILIKNLFVKCKNIIINLEKDLPYRIISLVKNLLPQNIQGPEQPSRKKYYFDNQAVKLFLKYSQSNEGLQKLKNYLQQNLFLIKNIYLHEIHLSLSLDLENNNFSNVMVIPHYQLVNSFMREKSLMKQIGEFYKTNILAKLPKLSFIFQNIKNPINLFRTMMKVSSALSQKIERKNILTFDHDQIPQNELQFSLQRWNFMHKKGFIRESSNPQNETQLEELLTFLYKNECYYMISNRNFIILSLNSKNISKEQEGTLIHYESSSEQSLGMKMKNKWVRSYENSMMRIIPLKDLEKIKLIRNKKYSEFAIQFKGNISINICDEYEKCAKLIDTINSLIM